MSPPHLRWLLAAPACGTIDSNISAADSVTISIRMIWLPPPITSKFNLSILVKYVARRHISKFAPCLRFSPTLTLVSSQNAFAPPLPAALVLPTEVTPNCFIVHRSQKADFLPPLGIDPPSQPKPRN